MPAIFRRSSVWSLAIGVLAWIIAAAVVTSPAPAMLAVQEGHAASDRVPEGDSDGEGATEDHGDGASHEGGAEHHDPYDLGHGNASPSLEDPANWRFDTALYTFIVFLVVLVVLFKFAWRPIMDGLERRERGIARMIEEAEQKLAQANEHLQEYEARLASAAQESKRILEEAHRSAEATAERIRSEAEEAARRERERAVQEIGLAKEQALQELADHVSQQVFSVARKVLSREVKPGDHDRLIQEALANLPSKN